MDGSHQELSHPKDILLLPDISNQMHVYEKNIYLTIFYSNPTSIFLNHVYVVKNKKKYNTVIFFFKYQTSSSCGEFTKYRLWRGSGTPRSFS